MSNFAADDIARKAIERAKELSGDSIPVDVEEIARRCGVVEIEPRPIPFDGYLARRPDGNLAIRYADGSPPRRVRFTIAHEIGHIIISEITHCPLDGMVARGPNRSLTVERLANRCASEILMPEHGMQSFLRSDRFSWAMVSIAERLFKVSRDAVCRRMMELQDYVGFQARIPFVGHHEKAACWFSKKRAFFLAEPPRHLYTRLLDEMGSRSSHSVKVEHRGKVVTMPLLGRVVDEPDGEVYRVVGILSAKKSNNSP